MVVLHSSMIKTLNILIEQRPNETTDGHRLTQIKTFFLYSISVHLCLPVVNFIISYIKIKNTHKLGIKFTIIYILNLVNRYKQKKNDHLNAYLLPGGRFFN